MFVVYIHAQQNKAVLRFLVTFDPVEFIPGGDAQTKQLTTHRYTMSCMKYLALWTIIDNTNNDAPSKQWEP